MRSRNSPDDHICQIILCTRGVIFLGTPHSGTDALASWAKGLATALGILKQTNPDILEALKRDSELLYRMQTEFHTMIRNRRKKNETDIDILCFFEELAMPGIGVVGQAPMLHRQLPVSNVLNSILHRLSAANPPLCLHIGRQGSRTTILR